MREILFKPSFQKDFIKIPVKIQEIFYKLLPYLKQNIFHPYLHTKPLSGKWHGFYSFRITQDYRCVFSIAQTTITLHIISHRKDVYN